MRKEYVGDISRRINMRFKEFCKKPRRANSSHIPASKSDKVTAISPRGVALKAIILALEASTAWLVPNMYVSNAEDTILSKSSRKAQPIPISMYLGLRFSRMYFLTSMRFDNKYTKGTRRITNSPTTNADPVPAVNSIIPPIIPVKKNVRIITRNASHHETL